MKELHVTVNAGDDEQVTHKVPLDQRSTVTVRSVVDNGAGQEVERVSSFGEIADIELVEVEDEKIPEPVIRQESPHLSTPQTVLQYAQSGPVADAGALVEQAVERYGADDPQVAEAVEVINKRMAAGGEPVAAESDVDATAAAAELAAEHGVDLETVEGSGVEGRVTKPDVEAAIAETEEA